MNKNFGLATGLTVMLSLLVCFCPVAVADDGHEDRHREKQGSHERYEKGEHREHGLKPVEALVYLETCGACHFAYQPALLPAASWEKLLAGLDDHFGEAVKPDDNARQSVAAYLKANSAETSSAEIAVKIMDSLEGQVPLRITDIFYIKKEHHGIPADVFRREKVGSPANCAACHTTAAGGVYDEDDVRIPR